VLETYWVATQHAFPFDVPIAHVVQGAPWGPLTYVLELINATAGWPQVVMGIAAILLVFFWVERRAAIVMAIASVASLFDFLTKILVARPRPGPELVHLLAPASDYSYPSGHAVFFTWLGVTLAYATTRRMPRRWSWIAWAVTATFILLACCARVWAGEHWPSDVGAGFLLGLGWSAAVIWAAGLLKPDLRRD
jgi:undecaprenyl-diphosphatase